MIQKPSIPKGTRDFGPAEAARRNYIFDTIREVYRLYGYAPIETPAMENLSTLLGKYGEEGDKLLFKVLNSGDAFSGLQSKDLETLGPNALALRVCEKGLRYDLTVPFARFVVQHQSELAFPFKRYQLQPVWRADRPQKGRYREFWQCDADVIGSKSLANELELVEMVDAVFGRLGIRVAIKINNRKVLSGLAQIMSQDGAGQDVAGQDVAGQDAGQISAAEDRLIDLSICIDKLDKVGWETVQGYLLEKGFTPQAIALLAPVLQFQGAFQDKIALLRSLFDGSQGKAPCPTGLEGVAELEELFGLIQEASIQQTVELDLTLARGLNYYTGAIFEVKALDVAIGSICGGGRYDNLTGIFGLPGLSGVGISFGADRIYDVLLALNAFPQSAAGGSRVLFFNLGKQEAAYARQCMRRLREAGIPCELYPDAVKMKKQFDYIDRRAIPFAAIVGETEMQAGVVNLKDQKTKAQHTLDIEALVKFLQEN